MQPQQLTLIRRRHGFFKKRVLHQAVIALPAEGTGKGWSPAIAELGRALKLEKWQGVVPTIILSSHFVHYAVIPWNSMLNEATEKQAYLKHCFALTYGDSAKLWDLRMSKAGLEMPALASGVEPRLLSELQAMLAQANFPACQHIRPHLMVAINHLIQQKVISPTRNSVWFVLLESGRICFTLINESAFITIKTCVAESNVAQQINAVIRRESLLCGVDAIDLPVIVSRGFYSAMVKKLTLDQILYSSENFLENDYGLTDIATNSINQSSIRTRVSNEAFS